jgi:hypothetical protein
MDIQAELVARIQKLGDAVERSKSFKEHQFSAALCDLIREIPQHWESSARDLCAAEQCPIGGVVIDHLQRDIHSHEDQIEYTAVFYPLMRVAIAIRSGELLYAAE